MAGPGDRLLVANVAVYLAQAAKKVVAIDADPAGGPLHQLLGAARPPRGFGEFLRGKAPSLNELIVDTPIAGVGLIGGEGSTFGASRPKQTAKGTLAAIAALDVDYVIVDLGPADSTLTIDLWLGADVPVLVTLPDPASIDSIYRFAKSAFVRRLRSVRGLDRLVSNAIGPPPAALDLYRALREAGGPTEKLEQEIRRYRPMFVVNQTRTVQDLKVGTWISSAARRRLGHTFDYLGHVESDETVWLAARRHRSLVAEYPEGKASKNIERLGRRLLSLENERDRPATTPLRLEEEQTYYEILETEPGVSDEEVRRAYRAIKDIYASGSLVISGLYEEHELAELHARVNAAHDTLFAPDWRRLYDLALPEADTGPRGSRGGQRRPPPPGAAERGGRTHRDLRDRARSRRRGDRRVPPQGPSDPRHRAQRHLAALEDQRALPPRHRGGALLRHARRRLRARLRDGVCPGAADGRAPGHGELPRPLPQEHGRAGAGRGALRGAARGAIRRQPALVGCERRQEASRAARARPSRNRLLANFLASTEAAAAPPAPRILRPTVGLLATRPG